MGASHFGRNTWRIEFAQTSSSLRAICQNGMVSCVLVHMGVCLIITLQKVIVENEAGLIMLLENKKQENTKQIQNYLQEVSQDLDSDIFVFSADITQSNVDFFIKEIRNFPKLKSNIVLILTTFGGDPDAAFRMAKFVKKNYKNFILFIFGYCKSAGTLLAIAANKIVMSDFGELGPLDIQVPKEGDLRRESGLNIQQSLKVIREEAPKIYSQCLFDILDLDPERETIPLKVVENLAVSIAIGLLKPISGQIDPARLGELDRQTRIAMEYGYRLNPNREKIIKRLTSDYPSHSFVIDYDEAQELFGDCVRKPTGAEYNLEKYIFDVVRQPVDFIGSIEKLLEKLSERKGDRNSESYNSSNHTFVQEDIKVVPPA